MSAQEAPIIRPSRPHLASQCALGPPRRRRWVAAAIVLATCTLLLGACNIDAGTGKGAASIVGKGIVNNPKNKSLRFEMIEFALHEFCRELLVAGAPLRLNDDQPVIGRFFADKCQAESIDEMTDHTIVVQFGGKGYAWTPGTGRMGFRARSLLELAPDFRLHNGALYVYFRPVQVDTSDFEVLMTETKLTQAVMNVVGLDEMELGQAIIDAQLGRGFTVVRYDADGHTDFALGLVEEGDVPVRPFQVVSSPKSTAASGRTELFVGQQDYLGRLHLGSSKAITLTLKLQGTETVDVAIIEAEGGAPILEYVNSPGPRSLPGAPPFRAPLTSAAPFRAEVSLPAGDYFVVFDHSGAFGNATPTEGALPARVDYLVQTGAAPQK